jgi:4-hydroxy-tetrahydrodipicolinate synthase
MSTKPTLLCRCATIFSPSGDLDEDNFRRFLQRFIDNGHGIYLASGGSGEGHALSWEELRRVYEIGVSECKGKIPVLANPPEQHTAAATIAHSLLAVEAGAEIVNIYGPTGWHGFRPTDEELHGYFDEVLAAVRHPVALAPNPNMGYTPSAELIARVCDRHHQVVAVNLSGLSEAYFVELRQKLRPQVEVYVPFAASLNALRFGAAGLVDADSNLLPETFRCYLDACHADDTDAINAAYGDVLKFVRFVAPWASANPRWIKMAMRVLQQPGGEGIPRPPYQMPSEAVQQRFRAGLLQLGVAEIDQLAGRAGLAA